MLQIDLFEKITNTEVLELLKCIGIKTKAFKANSHAFIIKIIPFFLKQSNLHKRKKNYAERLRNKNMVSLVNIPHFYPYVNKNR